jgi:hypothetical protein
VQVHGKLLEIARGERLFRNNVGSEPIKTGPSWDLGVTRKPFLLSGWKVHRAGEGQAGAILRVIVDVRELPWSMILLERIGHRQGHGCPRFRERDHRPTAGSL